MRTEDDPQQVEFEKKFACDATLVRVCPPDPTLATGPGSAARQVYRFQSELWTFDHGKLRRVEATPENVCEILQFSQPGDQGGVARADQGPWLMQLTTRLLALVQRN
jgi:hypothetical protein